MKTLKQSLFRSTILAVLAVIGASSQALGQQCDIVVQGTPTISPNPVTAGNSISVGYVIHNNGPANAGTSQTKIQIKNSSGTQITAPTFSAPAISAGANSPIQSSSVTIPAGTAAGTHTVYIILDNLSQLNQSNTANDLTPGVTFTVNAPVQQCDIVVQSTPTISPNPVTAGNDISVSYIIHNSGPGNAGTSQTKIQIKNSSGTQITAPTFSAPAINSGANSPSQSSTVTIPAVTPAGTYTAFVILDNLSQLNQSNTANDLTPGVSFTVNTPVQQCDIVVQGTPTISPNPVTAGNSISIGYVIHNNGPGNAGTSQTKIQIKNSSGTEIAAPTFSAPAINASANSPSQSSSVTIPVGTPAGTYTAYVILDNLSQLNQSNTANDLTPGVSFTVNAPVQQSDIVVLGTPTVSPNPVTAGNSISVDYVIHNNGPGNAGTSQTKIQIKNSSGTEITAPTFSAPAINASANSPSQSSTVTIPAGTQAGTYTAYVILDNLSELNQSNTANDLTPGVNFTVNAPVQQCDILVQGTPTISPNPVTAGNSISVGYVIHNNGPGNAGTSQTKIQIKNSSGTEITAPTFSAPAINASGNSPSQSSSVAIPTGTPVGTYTAYVILDNLSELDQSSTANDLTLGVNFTVNAPIQQCDIVVQSTPTISPSPVTAGSSISVGYIIHNNGPENAGTSQTKIQIKNSSGTQITAPTFSAPAVSAGANSPSQSSSVTIPVGTPAGTYRAYVILDNLSELNQSSSANDYTPGVTFVIQTTPSAKPDLAFQSRPTVSPTTFEAGSSTMVSFTVENRGTAPAVASKTKIWIKANSGQVIDSRVIDTQALNVGESVPQQVSLTIPASTAAGICSAQVILDNAVPGLDQLDEVNDYSEKVKVSVTSSSQTPPPSGYVEGIDFNAASDSQLNWQTAANAGVKFAYMKATERADFPSSTQVLMNNIQGAKDHGVRVGAYHFATPLFSPSYHQPDDEAQTTAVEEARHFHDVAKSVIGPGFLAPALDVEEQIVRFEPIGGGRYQPVEWADLLTGIRYDRRTQPPTRLLPDRPAMGAEALANWIRDWTKEVERLSGVKPILYCDRTYASQLDDYLGSSLNLWIADWTNPKGSPDKKNWDSWTVHQYQGLTPFAGTQVDLNVLSGSLEQMLTPMVQLGARGQLGFKPEGFCIELSGNSSETIMLQESYDCVDWVDAGPIELLNGVGQFTDRNANTTQQRFYRTKPPQ